MSTLDQADEVLRRSQALVDELDQWEVHDRAASVSIQPRTANRKLAPQRRVMVDGRPRNEPIGPYVTSTYVSIDATCSLSCPFLGNGCYAQMGMAVQRLDRGARELGQTGHDVAASEVRAIDRTCSTGVPQDGARGGRDLRLHVSGDASSTAAVRLLARAAERWQLRGGGAVWTFTHNWRRFPRRAWGPISVLASCETPDEVAKARSKGYAPAITTEVELDPRASVVDGVTVIPCPAQTRGTTCAQCRLCLDVARLERRRAGIAFQVHGAGAELAKASLRRLS